MDPFDKRFIELFEHALLDGFVKLVEDKDSKAHMHEAQKTGHF